jgi:tRNA dimethylallyltransferase
MPFNLNKPPLVVIVGPTAVGKTEVSLQLAERLDGEIVSGDSRLFYRGMNIGTAKPTMQEQQRVPHHLIDVADPDETWSLAVFQETAQKSIAEINQRGKLPFLVGGTGQYIRAMLEGWAPPELAPDPKIRKVLDKWANDSGGDELHRRLGYLDPLAADRIDPRNVRRTVRALEVIFRTGKRFSSQTRKQESFYNNLVLGIIRPRPELYRRIDERVEAMLDAGLVEEVRALLQKGYPPDLPTFSAIGYREIIAHLMGEISLEEAVMLIKRATRQFVRRQANWFKPTDPTIHWFDADEHLAANMEACIREQLPDVFAGTIKK